MKHLKITIKDIEALKIPINRTPARELSLEEKILVNNDSRRLAEYQLLAITRNQHMLREEERRIRKEIALLDDEHIEIKQQLNNPPSLGEAGPRI